MNFAPDHEETFRSPNGPTLSTSQPLVKAAFVSLNALWPAAISVPELTARARALLEENDLPDASRPSASAETDRRALCAALLITFTKGLCELHARPGAFTLSPGERPLACPLVRLQSTRGDAVTNRLHERLVLDNFARQLLPLLDGTRGKESLTKALAGLALDGRLSVTVNDRPVVDLEVLHAAIGQQLDGKLQQLARQALLVA